MQHPCRGARPLRLLPAVLLGLASCGAPGDAAAGARVRIAAVLPDPRSVPDERGEWIRLRNEGATTVDLSGWRVASRGDRGMRLPARTRLAPGATLTLARETDPARNGGVVAALRLTGIALGNRADWVALRDARGVTVDSVGWSATRAGVAVGGGGSREAGGVASTTTGRVGVPPRRHDAPRSSDAPHQSSAGDVESTPAAAGAALSPLPPPSALEVQVLDVGQGDAILVRAGGSTVLVDGGPDPARLGRHLDRLGLGRDATIDVVLLTHAHADHYQGLRELFRSSRRLRVRYFVENGDPSPNGALRRLRDSVRARVRRDGLVFRDGDDPCGDGRASCAFALRDGARLHVVRPLAGAERQNDRSVQAKLVSADGHFSMWLAGDAEQRGLAWLTRGAAARAVGLDVDVLKGSHHGSCDGVSPELLGRTSPSVAVLSLAASNDYGHVHARTKAMLRAARVPWYRTDQNGTITLVAPGEGGAPFSVHVERGGPNADGPSDRGARCD